MTVQTPTIGVTTVPGLLAVVANNAAQQIIDEQAIATLQGQIQALSTKAGLVPGYYTPPTTGGSVPYSAKSTAWSQAASVGRLQPTGGAANNYTPMCDVWDPTNNVDYFLAYTGASYTLYRVQRSTSAAPTTLASISLTSTNSVTLGVAVISPKVLRIYAQSSGSTTGAEYLVTWNGSALVVTTTGATPTTLYGSSVPVASVSRRGILCGTTSWLSFVGVPLQAPAILHDRGVAATPVVSTVSSAYLAATTYGVVSDAIANGYYLRGVSQWSPADGTTRPAIVLEQADDYTVNRFQTLRIGGTSFGGWTAMTVISNTLAVAQYKDLAGNLYTLAISINIGATVPLGLYGPYVTGTMGSQSFLGFGAFDATDIYAFYMSGLNLKATHLVFNPSNTGSELAASGTDLSVAVGSGIAGITAVTPTQITLPAADQVMLAYYATATSSSVFLEVFNLS